MKNLLTICFITLSFVSYTQSKKKQNELLKTEFETLKKEQGILLSERNLIVGTISSNKLKEFINLEDQIFMYSKGESKNNEINEKLKILDESKSKEIISDFGVQDQDYINFNIQDLERSYQDYKKTIENSQLKISDLLEISEEKVDVEKRIANKNVIYQSLILDLKKNIEVLKKDINVNNQISILLEQTYYQLSTQYNLFIGLIQKQYQQIYMNQDKLNSEKIDFYKNGPRGFKKEYFQIFPDVFPDYTSEGVKKPNPKKPISKSKEFIAPVVTDDEPELEYPATILNEIYYETSGSDLSENESTNKQSDFLIYDVVDIPAEFPGGTSAAREYIKNNMKYPQTATDMGIEGKCYLKFIVSENGFISNVKIIRGVQDCPECDQEAIRLIKSMPKFIPGKVNGKPVNSTFTLPVQFKLD